MASDHEQSGEPHFPVVWVLGGFAAGFVGGFAAFALLFHGRDAVEFRLTPTGNHVSIETAHGRLRFGEAGLPHLTAGPKVMVEEGESAEFTVSKAGSRLSQVLEREHFYEFEMPAGGSSGTMVLRSW